MVGRGTERDVQAVVRALTASSTHPVSAAVHEHVIAALAAESDAVGVCPDGEVSGFRAVAGKGIEATIGGLLVRGGSAVWAAGEVGEAGGVGDQTVFVVSVVADPVSE